MWWRRERRRLESITLRNEDLVAYDGHTSHIHQNGQPHTRIRALLNNVAFEPIIQRSNRWYCGLQRMSDSVRVFNTIRAIPDISSSADTPHLSPSSRLRLTGTYPYMSIIEWYKWGRITGARIFAIHHGNGEERLVSHYQCQEWHSFRLVWDRPDLRYVDAILLWFDTNLSSWM